MALQSSRVEARDRAFVIHNDQSLDVSCPGEAHECESGHSVHLRASSEEQVLQSRSRAEKATETHHSSVLTFRGRHAQQLLCHLEQMSTIE